MGARAHGRRHEGRAIRKRRRLLREYLRSHHASILSAQKAFLGMRGAAQEATLALGRFGIALQESQEQVRLLRLGHRWSIGSQTGVEDATARPTASERTNRPVCPQPCEHLSQEDAREGRGCAEHPCTCADRPIRSEETR